MNPCITMAFVACVWAGPAASSEWDLNQDGTFDLRDYAQLQNAARWLDGEAWFEILPDVPE